MASRTTTMLVVFIVLLVGLGGFFYYEDTALQDQNTTLNSTVSSLQTDIATVQAQNSQLQSQLTALQTAISSIGAQVSGSGVERVVLASYVRNGSLVISVGNLGSTTLTITQVVFDGTPVNSSSIQPGGPFTSSGNSFNLASGATGTLTITGAALGSPRSGTTYSITVVSAAGNSYPSSIPWP